MNDTGLDDRLRGLVAQSSGQAAASIDLSRPVADCGIDSLGLLLFREACERDFQVSIPDDVWFGFQRLEQLRDHLARRSAGHRPAVAAAPLGVRTEVRETTERTFGGTGQGDLVEKVEIGMPLTGINNLSESPLLKLIGDHRWAHLSAYTGVPSARICDEQGNRLYATFFYVEVAFPESRPMAGYTENDRLVLVSSMSRFGGGLLDGLTCMWPDDGVARDRTARFESATRAAAAGVPAVRLSNIFVSQFGGAEWLKKSRPVNPGFERIPELAVAPDSYGSVKLAAEAGHFQEPPSDFVPMNPEPITWEYQLLPDRDVNGAGLVYFANYPLFLDMAERAALSRCRLRISEDHVNRRTLVHRRSGYLGNASWKDQIVVETRIWVQDPFRASPATPEMAPVRLHSNQRMRRKSDGRVMLVSTCEKVLFGIPAEEAEFYSALSKSPA